MIKFSTFLEFNLMFWTFLYVRTLLNYLISFLQQPYEGHGIISPIL